MKPEITYPCTWSYTIIVSEVASVEAWIDSFLGDVDRDLVESKRSSSGRYISLHLSVRVDSETRRDEIFRGLQALEAVKVVL